MYAAIATLQACSRVLKLMLDGVLGRVLELYHAMAAAGHADHVCLDDVLCDLKLKPQVRARVRLMHAFVTLLLGHRHTHPGLLSPRQSQEHQGAREAAGRHGRADTRCGCCVISPRAHAVHAGAAEAVTVAEEPMTLDQAIRLLQIHERARQGRLRAKFMADIR